MTVEHADKIDIVAYDPKTDRVMLVMVEERGWGSEGHLLRDLHEKFKTYLTYVVNGQLARNYPGYASKSVRIELRCEYPLTPKELGLVDALAHDHLQPRGIDFSWQVIGAGPASHGSKPWWRFW